MYKSIFELKVVYQAYLYSRLDWLTLMAYQQGLGYFKPRV